MTSLLLALVVSAAPSIQTAPEPSWVVPLTLPAETKGEGAELFRLTEQQIRVTPKTVERYHHLASQALTAAGVDSVANFTFDHDPSFQKLLIHGVWVWRDGVRRSAVSACEVRTLQRERQMEERIYDGRVSTVLDIHDVRVGDTVEVAWTIVGDNPVFGGKVAFDYSTRFSTFTGRIGFRLLWEKPTTPIFRAHEHAPLPTLATRGSVREWSWVGDAIPPLVIPTWLPSDVDLWPQVEVTEWQSWEEVAQWSTQLFATKTNGPLLEAELKRLSALPEGEPRLREAVRFVQDDLRYMGVELGANSHQPHDAEWVLQRRFGDCKDKALLTVSLLNALGIEAHPALVNTEVGKRLDVLVPSPLQFDHAIAVATIDKTQVWIDATHSFARGALTTRRPPRFARALIVAPETTGLSVIARPLLEQPSLSLEQHWVAPRVGAATLTITTKGIDASADGLRSWFAGRTREEVTRYYRQLRERRFNRTLSSLQEVSWQDDEERNVVTVIEKYSDENFLNSKFDHGFDTALVASELEYPPNEVRTQPLAVSPTHVKEVLFFDWWEDLDGLTTSPTTVSSSPAYEFTYRSSHVGRRLSLEWELKTKAERVEVADLAAHRAALDRIDDVLGYDVHLPPPDASERKERASSTISPMWAIIALLSLASVAVRAFGRDQRADGPSREQQRRQSQFAQKFELGGGESAATALTVSDLASTSRHFPSRCANGHALDGAPAEVDVARLGGERISIVARSCSSCGASERRYFKLSDS